MDFARFLPLSNRPADDDSAVTSDRRNAIAEVVDEAARLTALAGRQRADQLAAEFARAARLADAGASEFGAADLPELATAVRSGSRRRTSALVHAVRAVLVLADELNDVPRVADLTLGVVSLYMATSAPLERRAVLEGTAMAIVRFLVGLSDVPPQPAKREG